MKHQKLDRKILLIGEGLDEVRFFKSLLKNLEISDVLVESYQGKDNLGNYLNTLKDRTYDFSELTSIGITRDADNLPPKSAFDSICSRLLKVGLPVPNKIGEKTFVTPSVNIFIFPNNRDSGMLEDLCLESVKDDGAMSCVEQYLECVKNNANREPDNLAKAKLHAWLASKEKPDKRLGEAAEAGYWDWESAAFDGLKEFILSLIND
ncbi:MAG: DUF3226 domain-containing protein [Cyanobacteriota bacterium]|nr:DUF3226 domain-containing protein [Cyanobacteriota bacterium]